MRTEPALHTLSVTVPEAIARGHQHLPADTRRDIESQASRHLLELSLVEQYRHAEIYLSDVAQALGLYPDIKATMEWLYAHGVPVGPTQPKDVARQNDALEKLLRRRREKAAIPDG